MTDLVAHEEEIRSISGKVLAFGMAAITLLVVVICGCLILALYSTTSSYSEQVTISQNRQEVISTLQRALDRVEGKLYVYEEFITDRRKEVIHKAIVKYLTKENTKSTDVTLDDFERWVGIGGR